MQIEVEVLRNETIGNSHGDYYFTTPNSEGSKKWKSIGNIVSLGTTMIDIKEPKKKKLVYQWLWENKYPDREKHKLYLTINFYGKDDRDNVRQSLGDELKEGGILRPLMESEKEINI